MVKMTLGTEGIDRICGRGYGGGFYMEPADSCHGAGIIYGEMDVCTCGGILPR